jgi:hypothetical protein
MIELELKSRYHEELAVQYIKKRNKIMKLAGIEKALAEGCKVHAFCSGGGLRVVRIEKNGKLKGYGDIRRWRTLCPTPTKISSRVEDPTTRSTVARSPTI